MGGLRAIFIIHTFHVSSEILNTTRADETYRLEAFARIVTSGFILDPEMPTSSLVTMPFSNLSAAHGVGIMRNNSQRAPTRLRQLWGNVSRPFALSHHDSSSMGLRSDTDILQEKNSNDVAAPHHIPDPRSSAKTTFLGNILRSDAPHGTGDGKEYLGLPFRLSVYTAQSKVERNVPYLRHSWNRIDFIAIVAFWISFALAMAGVEREPNRHIAVFRALSVLRTSRLLAVTNGTSVSSLLNDIVGWRFDALL